VTAPLAGIRVLACEHMQALPYGTQLMAMLGAEIIKVEPPQGEAGRAARPIVPLPDGTTTGGTFARNNLGKSSITVDLKNHRGQQLFLDLARHCDVVAENMRPGVMDRLGVGYADIAAVNPKAIYLSVSGFGNLGDSPYRSRPAYAPVVEAMAGFYEIGRRDGQPPRPGIAGPIGDTSAAMFGVIGTLAALRNRELTGRGQYVDVAMFDSMIAMNEMYMQVASLGLPGGMVAGQGTGILDTFRASDGYFVVALIREHQLARLSSLIGTDWPSDARFADRGQWGALVPDVVRPAVEAWAGSRNRAAVVAALAGAGIAAGPCNTLDDLMLDEHVTSRDLLIRTHDGPAGPVVVAGNPIRMSESSRVAVGPAPAAGEHTRDVLREVLGLSDSEIDDLRRDGVHGVADIVEA